MVIEIDPSKQVQLAARQGQTIFIDKSNWDQLDPANKTALMIHEMVYALQTPQVVTVPGSNTNFYTQNSPDARQATAEYFSADFATSANDTCVGYKGTTFCQLTPEWNNGFDTNLVDPVKVCSITVPPSGYQFVKAEIDGTYSVANAWATYESPDLNIHTYLSSSTNWTFLSDLSEFMISDKGEATAYQNCMTNVQTNQDEFQKFVSQYSLNW